MDHEYASISGIPTFVSKSLEFMFGKDSVAIKDDRIAAVSTCFKTFIIHLNFQCQVQSLSGTGSCRVAGDFIKKFNLSQSIYVPNPTWSNHFNIFQDAGLIVKEYNYYDYQSKDFNFESMRESISSAPDKSWFLLHACAHNPSGFDPTPQQWSALSDDITRKGHGVLFDSAYQGFASGDADTDAYPVRLFVERGHRVLVAQSFAKVPSRLHHP